MKFSPFIANPILLPYSWVLITRSDFLLIIMLALLGICPVRCESWWTGNLFQIPTLLKLSHDYFQHPSEHEWLTWSSVILPVGCFQDLSAGQEEIYSSLYDSKGKCFCQVLMLLYLLCACRIEMTCFYSNRWRTSSQPPKGHGNPFILEKILYAHILWKRDYLHTWSWTPTLYDVFSYI